MHAIFLWRHNVRYVATEIKDRVAIMTRFSDDEVNDGCGKYAESLFNHMFEKNQFTVLGRDTHAFNGKTWIRSNKNLDFIIQRDGIQYGVEIKNTFDYIDPEEFDEKINFLHFHYRKQHNQTRSIQ